MYAKPTLYFLKTKQNNKIKITKIRPCICHVSFFSLFFTAPALTPARIPAPAPTELHVGVPDASSLVASSASSSRQRPLRLSASAPASASEPLGRRRAQSLARHRAAFALRRLRHCFASMPLISQPVHASVSVPPGLSLAQVR